MLKFKKPLLIALFIFTTTSYQNCGQPMKAITGNNVSQSSLARFEAAKLTLEKNCNACHSVGGSASFLNLAAMSELEIISKGLIIPGKPNESKLIYRLHNSTPSVYNGNGQTSNMPPKGPIPSEDFLTLVNWITMIDSGANIPFLCNQNEAPDKLSATKLSKIQYFNSLKNFMSRSLGDVSTLQFLNTKNVLNRIPNDGGGAYTTGDNNFSASHSKVFFEIAEEVAMELTSSAQIAKTVSTYVGYEPGSCTYTNLDTLSPACRYAFVKNLLLRIYGRPVEENSLNSNNELEGFVNEFSQAGTTKIALENIIFRALVSPQFIFHPYVDILPGGTVTVYRLSSYAIARRLSLIYNNSFPDENLLKLAATKDLIEESAFLSALSYASDKMAPSINQFTKEWLRLDKLPNYSFQSHNKFKLLTTGINPNEELRTSMITEVVDLVNYIRESNKTVKDLFTSNISLARTPDLMKIYNQATPAPNNISDTNAVRFPAGERGGLLTRAAMLFTGGHSENPIHRSIHIRNSLLCSKIADPPPNLSSEIIPPALDGVGTTRTLFHNKTSGPQCISCHSQINPIGFAFSKYNSFGMYQDIEPVFNAAGNLVNELPTDAKVDLQVAMGVNRQVDGGIELSQVLAETKDFKSCLVKNYYAYAHQLPEMPQSINSCAMKRMYQSLDADSSLQDFFKSSTVIRQFRFRKLE